MINIGMIMFIQENRKKEYRPKIDYAGMKE